jgi:multicomponent Na+:H+ antiporter subunit E
MDKNSRLRIRITTIANLSLRLTIWLLLTNDFGLLNCLIGVAIALLLPQGKTSPEKIKDWLEVCWQIIKAIPQAYLEAIQMMLSPHEQEDIERVRVKPQRTPGLVFLDIFLITFTPKTIVTKYDESGWYEVHQVKPKIKPKGR